MIYILEFKTVSDTGEEYVSETQKLAEIQHLVVTQDLKSLFKDTQWTVGAAILRGRTQVGSCKRMT